MCVNIAKRDFDKWYSEFATLGEPFCKDDLERAYLAGYETGVIAGAMDSNELVRIVERTEHVIVRRRQNG